MSFEQRHERDTDVTITLIVPVYNVEKYLTQCLESIVGQMVPFDEVILVNDGSTDQSRSICEKYCLKYDYFKLINQENRGLSVARNVGLAHAASEYILFLDSDDYLCEDTVKRLKDELRGYRLDAVYFDADIHCEKGYEVSRNNFVRDLKDIVGVQMSGEEFFLTCYPKNYPVPVWLAVYKKEAIKTAEILFPEGLYYEDNYFTFAFMIQAEKVTYISEKLYQRRYRENSIMTSEFTERKFIDKVKIILLIWKEVVKWKALELPENKAYLKYINDYCNMGLEHRLLCTKYNIDFHDEAKDVFYIMAKTYEQLVGKYCLNDNIDLTLLNYIWKNLQKIGLYCPEYKISSEQLLRRVSSRQEWLYKKVLCDLPLNVEKCKVGIYGVGNHTKGLLAAYDELFGEITCNLYFVDSYREKGSYMGRDIIHYRQIDNSFDLIVISSFLYEREMAENIRSISKEVPIYTFYNILEEDIFTGWDLWKR